MSELSFTVEGEGEVILFLHGWGQNKEMMLPIIKELKNNYKCVLIDMPGFGGSSFNSSKDLKEYTEKIRIFLRKKHLTPKYIVGHSFGGKVATQYYLTYRGLKGLIIIASPLLKPKRGLKYYFKVFIYKLKKNLGLSNKNGGSIDYKNCKDDMKSFFVNVVNTHFNNELSKINIPTILIWGDKDDKVPLKRGKKTNKILTNSELYIQKGGHFAYMENIHLTRLIVQNFCRRLNDD